MSIEFEVQDSIEQEAYRKLSQGIKIFNDPIDADVDIVAVPGLGTDPIECWTYKRNTNNESNGNEEHIVRNDGKGFNWIRDPDGLSMLFPKARIMIYDYASAWRGKYKVRATMRSICESLLEELNEKRRDGTPRPLVFIGHSMGGIVIAKALAIAKANKEYEFTHTSTMGCAFFGVPFRGSNMAQLALLYSAVLGNDAYEALLSFMREQKNDVLDEVTNDFVELARKMSPPMEIFCVWEQVATSVSYSKRALKNMPTLLQHRFFQTGAEKLMEVGIAAFGGSTHFVSKESACLVGTHTIGLAAGHSDLVHFESLESSKFLQIKVQLEKMIRQAKYNGRKRAVMSRQNMSSHNFIKTVQRSLEGVDMRLKYRELAGLATTSWLTSETSYQKWRGEVSNTPSYLWLIGAAGLGKTNACLAALQQLEQETIDYQTNSTTAQNDTFLAYFLCDRSTGCNTAEELLKSLITQLISQESSLAQHARWFVAQSNQRRMTAVGKSSLDTQAGAKATATVDNLWKCLQDMMEDPVVSSMHIVVSNIHCLQLTDSTHALFAKIMEHAQVDQGGVNAESSVKWLISSRKEQQFSRLQPSRRIAIIDLTSAEYGAKIKSAREKHTKTAVAHLKQTKQYSPRLAWYVSNTIQEQSSDETWIDVVCILLGAMPAQSSDIDIRTWLTRIGQYGMDQLIDNTWHGILERNQVYAANLKDLMQVLTLTYEPPSVADLVVLLDSSDHKQVVDMVRLCAPILRIGTDSEHHKVLFTNAEFSRRLRQRCFDERQRGEREERKRHGLIALSCFQYIKDFYNPTDRHEVPSTQFKSALKRSSSIKAAVNPINATLTASKDDKNDHVLTAAQLLPPTYPAKYLFRHLSVGFPDVVQQLCEEDENFWGKTSSLRDAWLSDFRKVTPDLNELTSDGMSALHIAAGIGAGELVALLVSNIGSESLAWTSNDGMTALHVAAFNNHAAVVDELLRLGADVEAGNNAAGTPLHFAALRGNSGIMEVLIEKGANVNAYSQSIGPVINAAIRSGTVDAVNKIMSADVRFDSDYTKCEPPLSLSAGYSKPELFRDILESGREKWLQNTKLIDRALVEAATSGHLQSVRILLDFPRVYANDTLEDAISRAAREVNWAPAEVLLDFAIADTARGNRRDVRLDEVFYLAAAGRDERLEFLQKIWSFTSQQLKRDIVNFSLYEATALRKPRTALWLLNTCGANPNATPLRPKILKPEYTNVASSIDYKTILNAAASTGSPQLVEALIKHGATLDDEKCYALQLAAAEGHTETVEKLLQYGAMVSRKVRDNSDLGFYSGTALQAACDGNRAQVVEVLIKHGADPNLGGGAFSNPITSVTQRGHKEILKMLLASEAINVNVVGTEDRATPLINACAYMDIESVHLLLQKGAEIDAKNATGETALVLAAAKGKEDCVKLLCEHQANVIHKTPGRGVPITVAADALQPACARILADIMVTTIERYSEQEPRLNTTILEQSNELLDLRARYSDVEQHRNNLLREIDSHKQNFERLKFDQKAQSQRDVTRGAELQAVRVQLYSKESELHSMTEQLERAEETIRERERLLDNEKQANDTLRQREGWVELQTQINDATTKLEAEVARSQGLSRDIDGLTAASQQAAAQHQLLELQLSQAVSDAQTEKESKERLEAALSQSQEEQQASLARVSELEQRIATMLAAVSGDSKPSQRSAVPSVNKQLPTSPIAEDYELVTANGLTDSPAQSPGINAESPSGSPQPESSRRPALTNSRWSSGGNRGFRTIRGSYLPDGSVGGYVTNASVQKRMSTDSLGSSPANGEVPEVSRSSNAEALARMRRTSAHNGGRYYGPLTE